MLHYIPVPLLVALFFSLSTVTRADDVDLMQHLIDTVHANKGSIRTWKGTAVCEYEREDAREGKTCVERCKRSIAFAADATKQWYRSNTVVDTLELSIDGVKDIALPENFSGMIKDGTYYDFRWHSPDKEGMVIVAGKPVNRKGAELKSLFRTLPEIPSGERRSEEFFDPLGQMDYDFRDYTADCANLISEVGQKGTRNLPSDFALSETAGIFVFSRTIPEELQVGQKKVFITKETFDLNKGGLLIESYHAVKENDNVVSERSARVVPQQVGGVWIPIERTETISEPGKKHNRRLTWTKNEINVPVDDEFTFAKMGVTRGAMALDLKTGKESILTGDQYVAPNKPRTPANNTRIILLLASSACLVLLVLVLAVRLQRKRRMS